MYWRPPYFLIRRPYREYLALFKKTVAMHEVFLQRLAVHPTLRLDYNFQTFLEYEGDVSPSVCPFPSHAPSSSK